MESRRLDFTKRSTSEALRTGNPLDSITDPWLDFAALGVANEVNSTPNWSTSSAASAWGTTCIASA